MNYYGKVIGKYFDGNFLKEVLLQCDEKLPIRGPFIYQKGEYLYLFHVHGQIDFFMAMRKFITSQTKFMKDSFMVGL